MWGYVVGALVAYLLFKEKIAVIKRWIKRHAELIDKWKDEPEIMEAYGKLEAAIKAASFDRKWTTLEKLTVLGLAIKLFVAIKKYEEEQG